MVTGDFEEFSGCFNFEHQTIELPLSGFLIGHDMEGRVTLGATYWCRQSGLPGRPGCIDISGYEKTSHTGSPNIEITKG